MDFIELHDRIGYTLFDISNEKKIKVENIKVITILLNVLTRLKIVSLKAGTKKSEDSEKITGSLLNIIRSECVTM
jgi:hypothetical protein